MFYRTTICNEPSPLAYIQNCTCGDIGYYIPVSYDSRSCPDCSLQENLDPSYCVARSYYSVSSYYSVFPHGNDDTPTAVVSRSW